jgi:hypothetical protein
LRPAFGDDASAWTAVHLRAQGASSFRNGDALTWATGRTGHLRLPRLASQSRRTAGARDSTGGRNTVSFSLLANSIASVACLSSERIAATLRCTARPINRLTPSRTAEAVGSQRPLAGLAVSRWTLNALPRPDPGLRNALAGLRALARLAAHGLVALRPPVRACLARSARRVTRTAAANAVHRSAAPRSVRSSHLSPPAPRSAHQCLGVNTSLASGLHVTASSIVRRGINQ